MTPQIHTHPSPHSTILPHLLPLLPYTLPLVRRIQFHFHSPHAHIFSTIPPTSHPSPSPAPFADAYLDRSRAPETECWLFSTLELPSPSPSANHLAHLLALLRHIATLPLPSSYPPSQDPSLLLVGALHRAVLERLKGEPVADGEGVKDISGPGAQAQVLPALLKPAAGATGEEGGEEERVHGSQSATGANLRGYVRGHTVPYIKFLFRPEGLAAATGTGEGEGEGAPAGLEWTTVQEAEFPLVLSRTEIPRRARTLQLLESVGLRERRGVEDESGEPGRLVAWAFLGLDGSLTSLHVEPEWRGKGLGKVVTRRLFGLVVDGEGGKGFVGVREGEEWFHSDVTKDNKGSVGVAMGLGGEEGWGCFWGWVDLRRVVEGEEGSG